MENLSISMTRGLLNDVVASGEYSPLWFMIEDFKVNGHTVSFKSSNMFWHIVIDNGYVNLMPNIKITNQFGKTYDSPIDYAISLLER